LRETVKAFCFFRIAALSLLDIDFRFGTNNTGNRVQKSNPMKKYGFVYFGLVLLLALISWQSRPVLQNYTKLWSQVRHYAEKDLPRSALKVIDKIYTRAKAEGNESELVKSLLYRMSMESRFQENFRLKSIRLLQNELKTATPVEKSVLWSLLGQLYNGYYQTHLQKILTRETPALSDTALEMLDARQWQQKTARAYLASVDHAEETVRVPLKDFSSLLQMVDSSGLMRWPTLYDLLAHRAIVYFSSAGISTQFPRPAFTPDTTLLAPVPVFLHLNFSADTVSAEARVLRLFQHILGLHRKTGNTTAFLDADLQRLAYAARQLPDNFVTRRAYAHTLEQLLKKNKNQPVSVRITAQLASVYLGMENLSQGKTNYLLKAESLCQEMLKSFPDAPFSVNCKNIISRINRPEFSFRLQQALLPDKPSLAYVIMKNIAGLWFRVVRIPFGVPETDYRDESLNRMKQYLNSLDAVKKWKQTFPFPRDHHGHSAEMLWPALPRGRYVLFVSDDPHFSDKRTVLFQQFQVTGLALLSHKNLPQKKQELYLLDRTTGCPVAGASVSLYARRYDYKERMQKLISLGRYSTDAAGMIQFPFQNNDRYNGFYIEAFRNGDTTVASTYGFLHGYLYESRPYEKTYFFTDRAIYRPGQIVRFKALQIRQNGNNARVVPGKKLMVSLMSPQYRKLDELQLVTDSSGSVSGSFVLPDMALNGRFLLQTSTGSKGVLMENYKRPAFYVRFDTLKKAFALGKEVRLGGKVAYYFGAPADSIPVKYTVEREQYFPFPFYGWISYGSSRVKIAGGRVFTGSDGHFEIAFKAATNPEIPKDAWPVYRYVVHVEASDASGETHTAQRDIRLSRLSVLLKLHMPENVVAEQATGVKLVTQNLSGNPVTANVKVNLYRLMPPEVYLLPSSFPVPDTILMPRAEFRKTFPHQPWMHQEDKDNWPKTRLAYITLSVKGETLVFPTRLSTLKPGYYLVTAAVEGQPGLPVKKFFTVSSVHAKKLSVNTIFWHTVSQTVAEPGDVVTLSTGSARRNMHILFELLNGQQVAQRQWLVTGKKLNKLQIPVEEAFRGNFAVRLTAVADNRFFSWQQTVSVPFDNKKLQVGLATRRNYLKPGAKETWTITVSNISGTPEKAFVLAGMYDASLDVYAANQWRLFPYRNKIAGPGWQPYLFASGTGRTLFRMPEKHFPETVLTYPAVNWFGYPVFPVHRRLYFTDKVVQVPAMGFGAKATALNVPEEKETRQMTKPRKAALPAKKETPPPPLRTDFNATAFFYPDLVTDGSGKVSFSFQVPDVLTQWKFMVMAFTKGVKTGSLEQKIAARKTLMVLPNLPRFVRQGDTLLFAARVSNFSGKVLPAVVRIDFFDTETGRKLPLILSGSPKHDMTLKPHTNELVTWRIRIPDSINFLSYRLTAVSGTNSDGEERMIPVLSNRKLITESMPMFVKGRQKKQFIFESFLKNRSVSLKNFRYTLTFTSHPAWYAIQALPYLDKPAYPGIAEIFYRFYARALAAKLWQTYPRIRKVFEMWKRQSPDVFLSALQKNKALKEVVLQATPWVMEAKNETEQKRRVSLFFDLNNMQRLQQEALTRLQAAQLPSGAWSWFPDMPADFYTTREILSGLADLQRAKAVDIEKQPELKIMTNKALGYLDREMQNVYRRLKKRYPQTLNKNHLTAQMVRYCYVRSEFLNLKPADERTQETMRYFHGQLRHYWPGLHNDLQALAAMVLNRAGYAYDAEAVIRALNEKSLTDAQGGMFWRNDNPYGNQNAVSTETDMMKAFAEVMHDKPSVERMKTWLIRQKQANRWPGNKATADAVYALLTTGAPLLNETGPVEIFVGNKGALPLTGLNPQAGTGWFSKIWQGSAVTSALGKVTVMNPNDGMAYGAAYWQYFEDLDRVKKQAAGVSVEKQLFRQVFTSKGKQWVPLSKGEPLKTGDRIMVRLRIHSGRAVDFVQVSDMHAAAFEPDVLLSSYYYRNGLSYYEEMKDAVTRFFIRHLPKGNFTLEYPLLVTQKGCFSDGIARIQSLYLPSYAAHSSGRKIKVQ
jgi:hypothetical protein